MQGKEKNLAGESTTQREQVDATMGLQRPWLSSNPTESEYFTLSWFGRAEHCTESVMASVIGDWGVGEAVLAADLKSCLLYTSPSPRDQRGSRMPSSA